MVKNRKSAEPEESVLRDAKEVTAVEQYWHGDDRPKPRKPSRNYKYVEELAHLQFELIKLQEWVRLHGLKVIVLFEGRDAAGKGGAIKRIIESLNPRICRVVALGTPTERQRGQWYNSGCGSTGLRGAFFPSPRFERVLRWNSRL